MRNILNADILYTELRLPQEDRAVIGLVKRLCWRMETTKLWEENKSVNNRNKCWKSGKNLHVDRFGETFARVCLFQIPLFKSKGWSGVFNVFIDWSEQFSEAKRENARLW